MDFLRVFLTAPASIIALFLMTKLIGNKQMSNLTMFDYINGITIGSIAAEMATSELSDFWGCLLALVIYGCIVILLSFLSQKSILLRRFFTGKAIVLYDKGKLHKKNFSTAKIDVDEFLTMCRTQGFFNLDEVETIILEQNGQVSILPKDTNRPLTPDDMKIRVHQTRPEVVVLTEGKILDKNLKYTGNNEEWLLKQLKQQNKNQKDVFIAVCDGDNNLKIYDDSGVNPTNDIFE